MARRGRNRTQHTMTYTEERVAAETGRVLLALYRAGLEIHVTSDGLSGQASARIVAGPRSRRREPGDADGARHRRLAAGGHLRGGGAAQRAGRAPSWWRSTRALPVTPGRREASEAEHRAGRAQTAMAFSFSSM